MILANERKEKVQGSKEKIKKHKSFYVSIAILVVSIVLVLLLIFSAYILTVFIGTYEEDYNTRVMNTNKFIATQVDGDKIEEYAKTFKKDDYYFKLVNTMYQLKSIYDVEYLYIMADTGDPFNYTYIFDAKIDSEKNTYDDSAYGTKESKTVFPGSEKVLETGLSFPEARRYHDDKYGHLYYAYTPIKNSSDNVVAFLGTDIDATPMNDAINSFFINQFIFIVITFAVVFLFIVIYGKRVFSKPILKMTSDIVRFSQGELDIKFSDKILKRKDEFGDIYRAFKEVTQTITELVNDLNYVTLDVAKGKLNSKIENSNIYQGSYTEFTDNVNKMLENNRSLLDMMPSTVIFFDDKFEILYQNNPANRAYDIKFKKDKESATRSINNNKVLQNNMVVINRIYSEFLKSDDQSYSGTFTFAYSKQSKRHFNAFFIKIGDKNTTTGVCAVFTDVTEYVEMSIEAEASNKAKDEFLLRMSHEIRTPMNAIVGMTEITKRHLRREDEAFKNLETIETSTKHLMTIINDILDISKIEQGNIELSSSPFNLKKTIDDIVEIYGNQTNEKRIKVDMGDFENVNLNLLGDESRLKQAISNLLSNALKFSDEDSEVIMRLNKMPNYKKDYTKIRFAIIDYGIGIDEENKSIIFEAFEQAESSISRNYGGTGLGLSISNRIVKTMGGSDIQVESEIDNGSEFSFVIEFENANHDHAKGISSSDSTLEDGQYHDIQLSGSRILVVDDIELNREIVISLLEESGAYIETADDGTTAVKKFNSSPVNFYDIILMDIQMKEMDGYTATKTIRNSERADSRTVKIIAMSANAFQSDIDRAKSVGMDYYMTKPINYEEMINTIEQALAGRSKH